jgi:hypothetical protein
LLDDLGDRRGYSHLKEEALDRIKWRNRVGRGFGPVVWQITDDDDDDDDNDDINITSIEIDYNVSTCTDHLQVYSRM